MTQAEFLAIIANIENRMEDEGYFIKVNTPGRVLEGGWSWLKTLRVGADGRVIVLDDNMSPPHFIPLSSILSIQLSSR